jgi:protein-disulfide isomerase
MSTATPTKRERRDQARRERLERERAAAAAATRRRRFTRLGAALGAAAVVVVVLIAISSSGGSAAKSSSTTAASGPVAGASQSSSLLAGIPQKGITLGNANAPVRVVEFADLQCPFCRDFAVNDLPSVVRQYVRPGKVKMEFRSLAFIGPDSARAARVAEATGQQNKLWNFIDVAYHNQGKENSGWATDATLKRIAGSVPGLDTARAFRDRDGGAVTAQLKTAETLATSSGVNSTPTFLVGRGNNLTAVDSTGLNAAIKAALAR